MALKDFKRVDIKERILAQFQENIHLYLNQLNNKVLGGTFLSQIKNSEGKLVSIVIDTTTTLIPHGLSRQYQGWHLLDIQGDARVWRDTSSTSDGTKFLPLKASASVTVSLWVF